MRTVILAGSLVAWASSPIFAAATPSAWPREHVVARDDAAGRLAVSTPYYTVVHDLRAGGAIAAIRYPNGRAPNLLLAPISAWIEDGDGTRYTDCRDAAARVSVRRTGAGADSAVVVAAEGGLLDAEGRPCAARIAAVYEHRWGYIKIRKEFIFPAAGARVRALCPVDTVLAPSLSDYGYREGVSEKEGAGAFAFGSCRWARMRPGDAPLKAPYVPRYMMFVDAGVEGLEWFAASDLSQWEYRLAGRRGQGLCLLEAPLEAPGLALSLRPLESAEAPIVCAGSRVFDSFIGMPLLEGRARAPWLHASFNRNRGAWVAAEAIAAWAARGISTVHCHNDGDYYDDGLFWRDGSYPPYPPADMERYDGVLAECRRAGIRTATYFSNKELHPSTPEFKEHGREWGRMDARGNLRHNFFRGTSEFGAQMCLKSGWSDFLKLSIDRVLSNHKLDGVYYDWNTALLCCNAAHLREEGVWDHWDIDELIALMEWTRRRVGPEGLVIIHNTTTPMFVLENFADHVVATEWGYKKWTNEAPPLAELPLEWNLAGARSRGVISYGLIDAAAPRRLHRLFAIEALLGGVAPWPAGPETFELVPALAPLGAFEAYRFADWRQTALRLEDARCAAALYSRPGTTYALLANLDGKAREARCTLRPEALPYPLPAVKSAALLPAPGAAEEAQAEVKLDPRELTGGGAVIALPGDSIAVLRVE